MTAWTDSSPEAQDLAWATMDHATGSLDGGGPMTPFALLSSGGKRALHRFVAETLEEGLTQGRAALAASAEHEIAALSYDGYWTKDGERFDAVYVEVHERGRPASGTLAQRYLPGDPPELIGNAADVGDAAPLLGTAVGTAAGGAPGAAPEPRSGGGLFRRRKG